MDGGAGFRGVCVEIAGGGMPIFAGGEDAACDLGFGLSKVALAAAEEFT